VSRTLERQGVETFAQSFNDVMTYVESKLSQVAAR